MVKDSGGFVKSKAKGTVNFPPFESLDEHSLREIRRYQIYPWGKISEYCRHIPYNSGKKDFYDKTGRESFEVFQYIFKVPGDESEYTVMWDYNVGLVRMTPFFKCCKYSKTQPAKMLNLNPGLRDITHSITGGSIAAQGYWMPFNCAKAVCATFCAPIAGALIPIFGPDFPSQCTSADAPEHGRMQIDQMIVVESVREADMFRRMYANATSVAANNHLPSHHLQHHQHYTQMHHYSHGPALPSPTSNSSPRHGRRALPRYNGSTQDYDREYQGFGGRMRFKHGPESPYMTDSEPDMHTSPELHHALASHALARGSMMYAPPSPPRSSGDGGGKRPAADTLEAPGDYEEYSDKSSPMTTATTSTSISREDCGPEPAATSGTDKNAALLLMNLSVRDHKDVGGVCREQQQHKQQQQQREGDYRIYGARVCGQESMSMSPVSGPGRQDGHRNKRQRATSM
ncbi:hypothetical protein N0V93_009932 [Gnomoniopsis smithogilvyi]|uniref:HTH APSES-type domain-containing protein n=1 Tax=Gnomoniopsis smithogilvyi TaxID=1191159 RepID=A0A9W8YIR0_9PEZI|nr:hypothetical protein N0V93_009932 [Gnomoniopsis smithogilvyi]